MTNKLNRIDQEWERMSPTQRMIDAGYKRRPSHRALPDDTPAESVAQREPISKALFAMVDPLRPPGQPGSYARGVHNGIVAAAQTAADIEQRRKPVAQQSDLVRRLEQAALPDPHDEREVMHASLLREAADAIASVKMDIDNVAERQPPPPMQNDALMVRLLHPKHEVPTTRERAEMIEAMREAAERIRALEAEVARRTGETNMIETDEAIVKNLVARTRELENLVSSYKTLHRYAVDTIFGVSKCKVCSEVWNSDKKEAHKKNCLLA